MHTKSLLFFAGFILAATAAAALADSFPYSGTGFYAVGPVGNVVSGPYSTAADCMAAVAPPGFPKGARPDIECRFHVSKDPGWSSGGYYIVFPGPELVPDEGPYSSAADCQIALNALPPVEQNQASCSYEGGASQDN